MIRSLIWNVRGIVNKPFIRRMRKLIKLYKLSFFLALLEPKASNNCLRDYQRLFSCQGACCNDKGTIRVFWKDDVTLYLISSSNQHVQMEISYPSLFTVLIITFVYASCDGRERRVPWDQLSNTKCNLPWMVAGDFNIVVDQAERVEDVL